MDYLDEIKAVTLVVLVCMLCGTIMWFIYGSFSPHINYTNNVWGIVESVNDDQQTGHYRITVMYTVQDGEHDGTYRGKFISDTKPEVDEEVLLMANDSYSRVELYDPTRFSEHTDETKEVASEETEVIAEEETVAEETVDMSNDATKEKVTSFSDSLLTAIAVILVLWMLLLMLHQILNMRESDSELEPTKTNIAIVNCAYIGNDKVSKLIQSVESMNKLRESCTVPAYSEAIEGLLKQMQSRSEYINKLSSVTVESTKSTLIDLVDDTVSIFEEMVSVVSKQLQQFTTDMEFDNDYELQRAIIQLQAFAELDAMKE